MAASIIHSDLGARSIKSIEKFNPEHYQDLARLGISFGEGNLRDMMDAANTKRYAMDSLQPLVTTASITTPIQFLQNWLPGFVHVITAARKIDDIVGIMVSGAWEDAEIVQGILEKVGTSVPYTDYGNIPEASWNTNFVRRTVVQFEEGLQVGRMEEARAARIKVDSAAEKRGSAALALEIQRNAIGFYGFNNGANNTYGFLNDPNLLPYNTVAPGASTFTEWNTKTFLEITADIRQMVSGLRAQGRDQIDPETTNLTLVLPTDVVDYLTVTSDFGISVREWMTKTYPKIRVVSAPELELANAGANVGYLFADSVNDTSTDGGRTFLQVVPAKFRTLGVQQTAKYYIEDFSNATAGVMVKRPFAVYRVTGI